MTGEKLLTRKKKKGSEKKISIFGNARTGLWSCQREVLAQHPGSTDGNSEALSRVETSCLRKFAGKFIFVRAGDILAGQQES